MRKKDKITIVFGAMISSLILVITFPISIHGPVNLENAKLEDYEILSDYISKFKEKEGRLPKNFQEIGHKAIGPKDFFIRLAEKHDTSDLILKGKKIKFTLEVAWEGDKYEDLAWGKTKDGTIIRFPKYLLKKCK